MPIPQIKNKNNQSWRSDQKKYYVNTNKKSWKPSSNKKILPLKFKKVVLLTLTALFGVGFISGLILLVWVGRQLPDPNQLLDREVAQTTKIYDRTGEQVLYEIHGTEQRTLVTIDDIPNYMEQATIAIEDKNFYRHSGVSVWAIFRTIITNILRDEKAGGSTLTQQLIKNAILGTEKTYTRKLREAMLAYRLEQKSSKDEILQMYLNEIPYGSTAYGVEAASRRFFGKSVKDISLAEAAVLAALPQAPSRYSPYGSNLDLLLARQKHILDIMVEQGYISEEEAEIAKSQDINFNKQSIDIKAPHFVFWIKEILSEKYGEKLVEQGGLKITTTLDLYKQEIAENILEEKGKENEEKWNASNAGLVSIDPKTGQILAMVGSRDYFNDEIDGKVNIATSKRQPGSSMKPLVYTASFLRGYTPNTILYDVVTNFSTDPDKPYEPHNYDSQEHGPVTIRRALAGSLNIPAVKTIYLTGINRVLDLAKDLGYTTLGERDRYGLSLVLGGGEVKLLEHVNAFSAFSREGLINTVTGIMKIEDNNGNTIEEYKPNETLVIDPNIARMINNILSDNTARAYVFGENNWLTLGQRPVAAKTGTTNDYRDAWTVGYTPSIVTGVWVGNNNNESMKRGADGSVVAAPIWHDYMDKVLGDTPVERFREPEIRETGKAVLDGKTGSSQTVKIDRASGLLATDNTPASYIEEKTFAQHHSILYYVDRENPGGEIPKNPENDPQFLLWEKGVATWVNRQASGTDDLPSDMPPPTEYDNLHVSENMPWVEFITPSNNQAILDPVLKARINTGAERGISKVEYYINDTLFSVVEEKPFYLEKDLSFLPNGFYNLKARACDDIDNCFSAKIEINLALDGKKQSSAFSISLTSPSNGLALSNIDFPLGFDLYTDNPAVVAKINIYYNKKNEAPTLALSLQPIESNFNTGTWDNPPASGTYTVFAEAVTWDKRSKKTGDIMLTVNNTDTNSEQ